MKKTIFPFLLCTSLLLASCGEQTAAWQKSDIRWEDELRNPLFAERYWNELTDRAVELQLKDDEAARDPQIRAILDETRRLALERGQEAGKLRREGKLGFFVTVQETTEGIALLGKDALYLSPDFVTYPGPQLRLYLTTMIDPREGVFPDETSLNLARLESPYGAQWYKLPESMEDPGWRSVVLYDTKLRRLYGFAQVQ